MALTRKNGNYYVVYRGLDGKQVWRATGTSDKKDAQAVETALMEQNRTDKRRLRLGRLLGVVSTSTIPETAGNAPSGAATVVRHGRRLKVSDTLNAAAKYKKDGFSDHVRRSWARFVAALPQTITHLDQITPEIAFNYLDANYGEQSGKSWNNNKTYLNSIFRLVLIEAGLSESPLARIIPKPNVGRHQRPFTEDEFRAIFVAAAEPWKSAALIAWHTGLREKDVFALRWDCIQDDVIKIQPAKTARFGRAVQIPLHPQLIEWLAGIPRKNERILGAFPKMRRMKSSSKKEYFGDLLDQLEIKSTIDGLVSFNSFRNSFITRCDVAGIPRQATRGIVGHMKDTQTDLYSHDLESARRIQSLPPVKLP